MSESYFALISLSIGGGSYYYGSTPEEAVNKVARQFKADWSRIYKLKKGAPVKVSVYNVTDVPDGTNIFWDFRGVFAQMEDGPKQIERMKVVETELP